MRPAALVTGGSRGIGLAVSRMLCEKGYDVAVNGVRDESQVQDVLDDLKSIGTNVIYCRGDVGDSEHRKLMVTQLKSSFGRLNVLVNNAGVAPKERLDPLEATEESYDRVMRINLKGPYFLTQAIANWMVHQKKEDNEYGGTIVNIGSISATIVSVNRGEYCISKAGFAMHNKIWAVRLGEYDIPVYEIRPGVIKTDMTSKVQEKYDKLIADGLNVQPRWGYPEDVAQAVDALVNGKFPFSTGDVFMVDGGISIQRL
jgi:3-oxoacyl-[acyl-carrier protein] reductase